MAIVQELNKSRLASDLHSASLDINEALGELTKEKPLLIEDQLSEKIDQFLLKLVQKRLQEKEKVSNSSSTPNSGIGEDKLILSNQNAPLEQSQSQSQLRPLREANGQFGTPSKINN